MECCGKLIVAEPLVARVKADTSVHSRMTFKRYLQIGWVLYLYQELPELKLPSGYVHEAAKSL